MAKPKIIVSISKALLSVYASKGKNGGVLTRALRSPIEERILAAQRNLIENFESDSISQEIAAGPGVTNNPSGTLGGYGGLFSFIGFYRESTPVSDVVNVLSQRINFSVKSIGFLKFQVTTDFPTKDAIYKEAAQSSPIPWNPGRSWLDAIEHGISGLGQYLNTTKELNLPPSYSGRGLQIDATLRGGKFQNRSYISKYLNEFEREVKSI